MSNLRLSCKVFLTVYCLVCFVNWDINPSNWSIACRFLTVFFGFVVPALALGIDQVNKEENREKSSFIDELACKEITNKSHEKNN